MHLPFVGRSQTAWGPHQILANGGVSHQEDLSHGSSVWTTTADMDKRTALHFTFEFYNQPGQEEQLASLITGESHNFKYRHAVHRLLMTRCLLFALG